MLKLALFDLDDTLYGAATGLWAAIGRRIDLYMIERIGLDAAATGAMRRHYLETFGTTLNGLRHEYGIDPADYLAFVHDLPLERYLTPSPLLEQMLGRLPLRKVVFTNADSAHAQRVLDRLGIAAHFDSIFDVNELEFVNKPDPRAYRRVLALSQAQASECVFADDAIRNLVPAHALGMRTILVRGPDGVLPAGVLPAGVDHQIGSILELEGLLQPHLPREAGAGAGSQREGAA
jgi:putative hydrolase of the HAD superfamily